MRDYSRTSEGEEVVYHSAVVIGHMAVTLPSRSSLNISISNLLSH